MKRRVVVCLLLILATCAANRLNAQESPAAAAEREAAEERYKRMSAEIENLKETVESYRKNLNDQREEIRKLNEEIAHLGNHKDLLTRDDFKQLADKIREVDERRIAGDKELLEKVREEFARLGKSLQAPSPRSNPSPPPSPQSKPQSEANPTKPTPEKGSEYTIRAGDNPRVISQALGKLGVKVTSQQIIDANPTIKDWTKLRVGQKIFIPAQPPM